MMIAIAIVAITASVLFRSNTGMLRQQGNLEQHTIAHWILIDQIAQFRINHIVDPEQILEDDVVRVFQDDREYEIRSTVVRKPAISLFDSRGLDMVEFRVYERRKNELIGPLDSITVYFVDRRWEHEPEIRRTIDGNMRRRGDSFNI